MRAVLIDTPSMEPKSEQKRNVMLGYTLAQMEALGNACDAVVPVGPHWPKLVSGLAFDEYDAVVTTCKWWHELPGSLDLLSTLAALPAPPATLVGGRTAEVFGGELMRQFPFVSIIDGRSGRLPVPLASPIVSSDLALSQRVQEAGLLSGFVPLSTGCLANCYFCGRADYSSAPWLRTPSAVARDIEVQAVGGREVFFDTEGMGFEERLLLDALSLVRDDFDATCYYFAWGAPNMQILRELDRVFRYVTVCLDLLGLDDQAKHRLRASFAVKDALSVNDVLAQATRVYAELGVQTDVSFAVGHPFELNERVLGAAEALAGLYRSGSVRGEVKCTPLHVLPATSFEAVSEAYRPHWRSLEDFERTARPIHEGAAYYDVVLSPPDGMILGYADRSTGEVVSDRYRRVMDVLAFCT